MVAICSEQDEARTGPAVPIMTRAAGSKRVIRM